MNYLRFFILYFVTMYIYIYICNDFKIFIFYSDLLKYCKALITEKYKRYINVLLLFLLFYVLIALLKVSSCIVVKGVHSINVVLLPEMHTWFLHIFKSRNIFKTLIAMLKYLESAVFSHTCTV